MKGPTEGRSGRRHDHSTGFCHESGQRKSRRTPVEILPAAGKRSGPMNAQRITEYAGLIFFLSVNGNDDLTPLTHSLMQNFPNPFNPQTTITLDLPEGAHVRLRVFDVLGREVAVLADEHRAAGEHSVQFEAQGLPSGVYYYRLELGATAMIRTMILAK